MQVGKGFTSMSNMRAATKISDGDRAREEVMNRRRLGVAGLRGRAPVDMVMIHNNEGRTQDIVTGTPPAFKVEARSAWAKRREEASIEGLFR